MLPHHEVQAEEVTQRPDSGVAAHSRAATMYKYAVDTDGEKEKLNSFMERDGTGDGGLERNSLL